MQRKTFNKLGKLVGIALTLASFYFLLQIISDNYEAVLALFQQPLFYAVFIVGVIIYVITFLIIVASWHIQLNEVYPEINFRSLTKIVGISQIAKYLPGNLFHIAGRFYMSIKLGVSSKVTANTLIFESIMIIFSAALLGGIYLFHYGIPGTEFDLSPYWVTFGALATALMFYYLKTKEMFNELVSWNKLLIILSMFAISHLLTGGILQLQSTYLLHIDTSFIMLSSALALSFIIGYVTPGSPGGIGIRELVFIKLTTDMLDESNALSLILSLRIISMVGDVLIYLVSLNVKNQIQRPT